MSCVKLYPYQSSALDKCKDKNKIAFYHDM